jgi:threonine aldolase
MTKPDAGCQVSFRFDAPEKSARETATEVLRATEAVDGERDSYSRGGIVEQLERSFARILGKERAIFMPTGTLANHLAVRALMGGRSRVLLQEQGHLYNDSGDCLQRLSGFNSVPLGRGRASFGIDEVKEAFASSASARVKADVGAIVIETPVRRMHGELFDSGEMKEICAHAREREVGLHLDGARLFIASAYSGIPVETYASLFDTVYVSLYKYFNSPSGAVLAGPAGIIEGLYHERRMFGGGLNEAWIFAAMALHSLEGFPSRFTRAVAVSETFKESLRRIPGLAVSDMQAGTNVFKLETPPSVKAETMRDRLWEGGIRIPSPDSGAFSMKVNESILAVPCGEIADRFAEAVRGAASSDHRK